VTLVEFDPSDAPLVSVVVVLFGGWDLARGSLEALREHTDEPFEVVVVDNPSNEHTAGRLRDEVRGATVVPNPRNVGFGPAANQGASRARGRYLVFLNADTVVQPGWLGPLVAAVEEDPAARAASPMLLGGDGSLQEAGGIVFGDGRTLMYGLGDDPGRSRYRFRRYVDYGSAACLLIERSTFVSLGGFDPVYVPAYCEDVDLLLSLRARGPRTVYQPRSRVVHVRFGSAASERSRERMSARNTRILRERWAEALAPRPPLQIDPPLHHRVVAVRDADAPDRILVLGDTVPEPLVAALGRQNRRGRVTFLATGIEALPSPVVDRLADAGVEVEGPLREQAPWWRERLFHYTAVVPTGPPPRGFQARMRETQPQASLIDGTDPQGAVAELRRVGLLALEPAGPAHAIR
jgi:O-antigen biosynthesis protein